MDNKDKSPKSSSPVSPTNKRLDQRRKALYLTPVAWKSQRRISGAGSSRLNIDSSNHASSPQSTRKQPPEIASIPKVSLSSVMEKLARLAGGIKKDTSPGRSESKSP